jgi:DsbC/DsbD-like thiol-disulfide interchange protein
LYNFGYDGEVLLPVTLDVPFDLQPGASVHIAAVAKWLVCREECIPGKTGLVLDLPVAAAPARADPRWAAAFDAARSAQPQAAPWSGAASIADQRIRISLRGDNLPDPSTLDAFVVQRKLVDNRPAEIRRDGDVLLIETSRSEYFTAAPARFDLWLTASEGAGSRGWKLSLPLHAGSDASTSFIQQQPER